ncbi:MAG: hypothetical protein H6726_11500 [Sandaracinaceae bacterium]|nr:hypothetical protein [Sandaracinaceae bacterium]
MTQTVKRGGSWLKLAALSTSVVGGASLFWLTQETSVVASAHARDVAADVAKVGLPHGVDMDLRSDTIRRPWSYIPPQCYTRTQTDAGGQVESGVPAHNPCYACHQDSRAPNFLDDADAQTAWSFAEPAVENPWSNLFRDRRAQAEALRDEDVDAYVRGDNYFDPDGSITLARVLREVPTGWDSNADGRWSGYTPDCYFDFDAEGFDRDPAGRDTGWRVFAYYPFLGTFFPTNGATDDVLIRLPAAFRAREDGTPDRAVYAANLAIVEAVIRQSDIAIAPTDEAPLGVDLDGDGELGTAVQVRYRDPLAHPAAGAPSPPLTYVGRARTLLAEGDVHIGAGRYPEGTEFLHSVRYLGVGGDGRVGMAQRMKELRYMVKTGFQDARTLRMAAYEEVMERRRFPDRLRHIVGTVERGVVNGQGWRLQGFIEDAHGALRPQTLEESTVCVGCHSGIGAITDGTFAFPRRFAHGTFRDGWYHWRERGFEGVGDPTRADGRGEFATYVRAVGGGDEFRGNDEVRSRFFDEHGQEHREAFEALRGDLSTLLLPSPARARALNVAYWVTVREQSFWQGRDASVTPAVNVHARVELDAATGVEEPLAGPGPRLGLP